MKPIAYFLATFPTLTETFVVGELLELRQRGMPIVLFALRESQDPIQQPEAQALRAEVNYASPLYSPGLLAANLGAMFRRPTRYLQTLWFLIRGSWRNPIHLLKTLYLFPKAVEFADWVVRRGIGHIHAHWATYPATAALVVSELTGVSYSFTAHAWDVSLIRTLLPEKLRLARFAVTCTRENQLALRALLPNGAEPKIHLNYHGIALERFAVPRAPSRGAPVITACGTLFARKGFIDLVQACGILKRRGRRFRCVIIGEGPQRRGLEALIAAEGVKDEVTLTGALPQTEVVRWYSQSYLFVLPCLAWTLRIGHHTGVLVKALEAWFEGKGSVLKDGIPNALVEAMAMGIPVISTRIAGIPELVRHEENGMLVPPEDPARLAEAMDRLLLDPQLGKRLGERGAADVRARFDRRKNVEALAEIFASHLDESFSHAGSAAAVRGRSPEENRWETRS